MTRKLDGIPSLAYMGTNASSPPNVTYHTRPPTANDWENFIIGDIWQVENQALPTGDQYQIWTLVSLSQTAAANRALWLRVDTGGGGALNLSVVTNSGTAVPTGAGVLNFPASTNITTSAPGANSISADLTDDVTINNSLTVTGLAATPDALVTVDNTGLFGTSSPTANGQIPIGAATGSFAWQTITAGSGVTVVNGANSITINSTGGSGGIDTVHNDSATDIVIDPVDTSITINGGNVIEAIADPGDPSNHTLLVQMTTTGTDGQIPISATGGSPAWASVTGAGGITINAGANTLEIDGSGIGSSITFTLDDATTAVPSVGAMNVLGGTGISGYSTNIHTYADPNGGVNLYVGLNDSINWPSTNVDGTANDTGVIQIQGTRFLHAYGTDNTWVGGAAGRRNVSQTGNNNTGIGRSSLNSLTSGGSNVGVGKDTLTALTQGNHNVAVGNNALESLVGNSTSTYGYYNVAVGSGALQSLANGTSGPPPVTANSNTAIGRQALNNLTQGTNNIAVGIVSGTNYNNNESYNILIGNDGVNNDFNTIRIGEHGNSPGEQDTVYIAGIQDVPALANDYNVVFINTDHQVTNNPAAQAGQILYSTATSAAGGGTAWGFLTSSDFNVSSSGSGISINDRRVSFFVYGGGSGNPVTGDGTTFWLGEATDNATLNNFSILTGASYWSHTTGNPGYFTAPYTGMYFLQTSILLQNYVPPTPPPPPPAQIIDPVYIFVEGNPATQQLYQAIEPTFGASGQENRQLDVFCKMTAGDTARFGIQFDHGALDLYTVANTSQVADFGIHWCSGYLVHRL